MRFRYSSMGFGTALALSMQCAGGATTAPTLGFGFMHPATNSHSDVSGVGPRLANAVRASTTAANVSYKLKDIGSPPSNGYRYFSPPYGFNKTGQLVGDAYLSASPGSEYQQCIAWSGTAWVHVGPTPTLNCYATSGVSDANSEGDFAMVGETQIPTDDQLLAYYAVVSPKSSTLTTFEANAPSELYAVNASGLAAGFSYYEPVGGFAFDEPAVTSTGSSLGVLQPGCTTAKSGCLYDPYMLEGTTSETRSINAHGTILGNAIDQTNGPWVEYTGGTKPTYVQFSLPTDNGNGAFGVRGIDDADDVVYEEFDTVTKKYLSWTYSPAKKKTRSFGTISGNACTQYVPLYINGPGRVLGETESCSFASDETYWTWDATNGIVPLTFSHSAYNAATLDLINDAGQIAVDLTTTAGHHHWGILTPPSKL